MASEVGDGDEEKDEIMDIEEEKDTTDEACKELFSLESILLTYSRTCTYCYHLTCVYMQFSQSLRSHKITMGYYMVTIRDIVGTVAGGYIG